MGENLHEFTMKEGFLHEDEGTAYSSPASVISVMENAKTHFPGILTTRQLSRSLACILDETKGFSSVEETLLATSLSCDEVCRDMEDELKAIYGQNFSFGGIAGFPFGGCTAFGGMCHHIPKDGSCLIVYASHTGIDFDGVVGKVNRRGHHGSGTCCVASTASLAYVKAVNEGRVIHSPDPSDPIDAQQVFVDSAVMKHSDRLLNSTNPEVELPHVIYECQKELMERIIAKCVDDIPEGTSLAILGGVQVNTPVGTPDYFLPKTFNLCDSNGEVVEDLLDELMEEGHKDLQEILRQERLEKKMAEAKNGLIDIVTMCTR